jgi:hypothetical protein
LSKELTGITVSLAFSQREGGGWNLFIARNNQSVRSLWLDAKVIFTAVDKVGISNASRDITRPLRSLEANQSKCTVLIRVAIFDKENRKVLGVGIFCYDD